MTGAGVDGKTRLEARLNLYMFGMGFLAAPEVAGARAMASAEAGTSLFDDLLRTGGTLSDDVAVGAVNAEVQTGGQLLDEIAKGPIEVTEASIAQALEGSTMQTVQEQVSLPMVERYVRMLESGSVSPPIKVANGVIVDGNHRYIAGRLFGVESPTIPGVVARSQEANIRPIQKMLINPLDWGEY